MSVNLNNDTVCTMQQKQNFKVRNAKRYDMRKETNEKEKI